MSRGEWFDTWAGAFTIALWLGAMVLGFGYIAEFIK